MKTLRLIGFRLLGLLAVTCTSTAVVAQEASLKELKLVRTSNGTSQTVSTGATASQTVVLPATSASGTGKGLKITSVSGSTMALDWETPAAGLSGTAAQLSADAEDATAYSTGPEISVTAGKEYRIIGFFRVRRGTTGSEDDLYLRINTPSSTTYKYTLECFDCPANTTIVPTLREGTTPATGTLATETIAVDPGGVGGDFTGQPFLYRIEGTLLVTSTGTVRLTFNKIGGAGNVFMLAGSYWALQEIE